MPFHIALYEPEIPPNTGNIIRLCANLGGSLHLIEPLGFKIDDAKLRRAGLDYTDWEKIHFYSDWAHFISMMQGTRIFACTTKAKQLYTEPQYQSDDVFLFGPETRGLPSSLIETFDANRQLRIPMQPNNRSLNLSNAVAVIAYEAWRQQGFMGGASKPITLL